ncbi:hypothetical protein D3C75_1064170 [compost metagenome]
MVDGITEKAVVQFIQPCTFGFRLYRRIVAQGIHRHQHGEKHGQFGNFRHHGLDKNCGFAGINPRRQIIQRHLLKRASDKLRPFKMRGQRLNIRKHHKAFMLLLQHHPVFQASGVMAQMQLAGDPVSCQYPIFHCWFLLNWYFHSSFSDANPSHHPWPSPP